MNKYTLSNLTHAHGWLGIIISGFLFLIFFAGAISLFRNEIYEWSVKPTHAVSQGEILSVSEIMSKAIEGRSFDAKEHLTIIPPSHDIPYYQAYVDLTEDYKGEHYIGLLMDPVTGEVIGETGDFILADFIYRLHRDLNVPYGLYFMGFVTLFFFFIVISGVVIHARKLLSNFFQYRTMSNERSQLLDMHNVVGTISLPFTIMYALSGLVFNLVIIYQIAFAVILYKGDQEALLHDAGVHSIEQEWLGTPYNAENIDSLVNRYTQEFGNSPMLVRMQNYGDKNAVMHLIGDVDNVFAQRFEIGIKLIDESELFRDDAQMHSEVRHGTGVLRELHYGSFAGVDLRLVYFVLSIAVCALIVTGNLLWIEKRQKRYKESQRSVHVMKQLTLVSTLGVGVACCFIFLVERLMPLDLANRPDILIRSFIFVLLAATVASFYVDKQRYLVGSLAVSSGLLLTTVLSDWLIFSDHLLQLLGNKEYTVFGVQLGITFIACLFTIIAKALHQKQPLIDIVESDELTQAIAS